MVQRKELFESLLKLLLVVICPLVSACEHMVLRAGSERSFGRELELEVQNVFARRVSRRASAKKHA